MYSDIRKCTSYKPLKNNIPNTSIKIIYKKVSILHLRLPTTVHFKVENLLLYQLIQNFNFHGKTFIYFCFYFMITCFCSVTVRQGKCIQAGKVWYLQLANPRFRFLPRGIIRLKGQRSLYWGIILLTVRPVNTAINSSKIYTALNVIV
jgi:hypothetical protein